jgi:hypothetical protein
MQNALQITLSGSRPWTNYPVENIMLFRYDPQHPEEFLTRLRLALDTVFTREVTAFKQTLSQEYPNVDSLFPMYESRVQEDIGSILQPDQPDVETNPQTLCTLPEGNSVSTNPGTSDTTTQSESTHTEVKDAPV